MRRSSLAFTLAAVLAVSVGAQTPAKAAPCSAQSVLMTYTQPVYGVGAATIKSACPAFRDGLLRALATVPDTTTFTVAAFKAQLLNGIFSPPAIAPSPPIVAPIDPPVATQPPIVAPGGICANEPAGSTRFEDQPWNTALPTGWRPDYDSWPKDNGAIVTDATAPLSPSNVVAGKFAKGDPGGSAPFYVYRPFAASEQFGTLYACVVMKHSADFDNTNGNAGSKFLWPAGDQIQGGYTYITFNESTMDVGVNQQGATEREMYANTGKDGHVYAKRGTWVQYEFLLTAGSATAANGGLDIWINGVQTHHYTDVRWTMAADRKWKSLAWNPTYGGGLNPVPHDQYEYIDHLRLSGIR